jgi:hypothetical protein
LVRPLAKLRTFAMTPRRASSSAKVPTEPHSVRVRGHAKAFCHLMFGVLALAIDHLMRLITQFLTNQLH